MQEQYGVTCWHISLRYTQSYDMNMTGAECHSSGLDCLATHMPHSFWQRNMAACQPCLPACLILACAACRATHTTHTQHTYTPPSGKSCTLCHGWLTPTACFCSGHVCPIQDSDLAAHRVVLDDKHEEQKGCGTAASACLLHLQRGPACLGGRDDTSVSSLEGMQVS